MNKIRPPLEFALALFRFMVEPRDANVCARLANAIDEFRRVPAWKDASPLQKQQVTAADRALSAKPEDLERALQGLQELARLVNGERSMEEQVELEREKERPRQGKASTAAVEQGPAVSGISAPAPAEPPHTRWDERADLQ